LGITISRANAKRPLSTKEDEMVEPRNDFAIYLLLQGL
jgi:hypothetical protein